MRTRAHWNWLLTAGLSLSVALSGCSEETAESSCADTQFTAVSGDALYVSSCGSDSSPGTQNAPFASLAAAVAAAPAGAAIVIDAGTYGHTGKIGVDLRIVGAGEDKTTLSHDDFCVDVDGAEVVLEALTLDGCAGAGASVSGQSGVLTLREVAITDTRTKGGEGGNGVQAQDALALILESVRVEGSAGIGVLAQAGWVSIIEPSFSVPPRSSDASEQVGIIEPSFKTGAIVRDNAGGGISIIEPSFMPSPDENPAGIIEPSFRLYLAGVDVRGNTGYGLALFGSMTTRVEGSVIGETLPNGDDIGDGIVITGEGDVPFEVTIDEGSLLVGSDRAGIVVQGAATVTVDGEVSANGFGGVWSNDELSVVHLSSQALLGANGLVGAAAAGEGAMIEVAGARIVDTYLVETILASGGGAVKIGDGMGVFTKATGNVSAAFLGGNARAGLVSEGAGTIEVSGSTFSGGEYGVAMDAGTANKATIADDNTFADQTKSDLDLNSTLPVKKSPCKGNGC